MAETQKEKLMRLLDCSAEEAEDVMRYDAEVDNAKATTKLAHDLSDEQKKIAQQFVKAGTKKPTIYKFDKPKARANPTKEGIISEVFAFLSGETCGLTLENVEISNKSRQISFKMNGKSYDLTLVEHRK